MEILEQGRGTHFDPAILDAFHTIARELCGKQATRATICGRNSSASLNAASPPG